MEQASFYSKNSELRYERSLHTNNASHNLTQKIVGLQKELSNADIVKDSEVSLVCVTHVVYNF